MLKKIKQKVKKCWSRADDSLTEYKPYCGYNCVHEYKVVYQQGEYDGTDETWREVGIPATLISKINKDSKKKNFNFGWHFEATSGMKKAIISFDDPDYAFWFSLKEAY